MFNWTSVLANCSGNWTFIGDNFVVILKVSCFVNKFLFVIDEVDKPFEVVLYKQPSGLGMSLIGGGQHGNLQSFLLNTTTNFRLLHKGHMKRSLSFQLHISRLFPILLHTCAFYPYFLSCFPLYPPGPICIKSLIPGGPSAECGALEVGDILLQVRI